VPAASRDVVVRFVGDTGNLARGADEVSGRIRGVTTSLAGMAKLGGALAGVSFFGTMVDEARDAERTGKQTEAVLRSTGGAANLTAKQIGDLAEKLSEKVAVDDEVIQHGENVLLTFKNVRDEAGKGNDIFSQTTEIALDMSAALSENGDASEGLQGNMVKLGKALNDPVKGITALTKVGVTFTDQQKTQIKQMTESGDIMGAQKLILQELQSEFGGMAEASADSIGKAQVSWGNFAEEVGLKVMPAVNAVSNWALTTGIPALGQIASVVGDVVTPVFHAAADAGGFLVGAWQSLPGPIQSTAVAMAAWAIVGDRVTGFLGNATGPLKTFRTEVTDMQRYAAASGVEISKLGATFAVMEGHSPGVARVGEAFRNARGDVGGFGSTVRGVAAGAMTGFKSAAQGLMGFLGGPWGLVVGGAAAILSIWISRQQAAKQAAAEHAARVKTLTQEIENNGGAVSKQTKLEQIASGEKEHLYEIAQKLGISQDTMTRALLGNNDAIAQVNAAFDRYGIKSNEFTGDTNTAMRVFGGFTGIVGDTSHWGSLSGALTGARSQFDTLAGGMVTATTAAQGNTEKLAAVEGGAKGVALAQQGLGDAMGGATTEIDEQKQAVDDLVNALRTYWSESAAQADNQVAWEQQWDDLGAAIKENGVTLDVHTEKGRNNRGALTALIKTSQDMMAQDIAAKVPIDRAAQAHANRTNKLIAEAKRTGMNTREVGLLIGQYNGVPKNITTWLQQKGLGPVKQNLAWLTAIQTLLKDGIEATPAAINARMRKASGYTSSGKEDYAGGRATGGLIRGPGGPRSDKAGLFRLSNREFVQQAAATDYYGVSFMKALNEQQIPREMLPGYARGGLVAPYPVNVSKTKIPTQAQVISAYFARNMPRVAGGAGVQRWAPFVLRALSQLHQSPSLLGSVLRRMNQESGGNPNAINLTDINAQRGYPSQGLMQTIPQTFAAYAGPYRSRGITDPMANIYAGLNYALHRYGSIRAAMDKPGGYRNGGWLKPGQLGYNETSKPEAVFTQDQLQQLGRPNTTKILNVGGIHVTNQPTDVIAQIRRLELLEGMS
jgi:hypothetical protein